MKTSHVAALCLTLLAGVAHAADPKQGEKPLTDQQARMASCNKEAADMKGDERKAFMKTCLSGENMSQQDKMKKCNVDANAKDLKGDERKQFMSQCLKGSPKG
jgi:hypothetical protein